ncbi:MAG TPA: alpha/beta hydrolase [Caulobacteraceae bacterium]|jgi:acetyl esterase/lipase|nr:alpha/beta hydrolase [Caulobacteraceae bacterium]
MTAKHERAPGLRVWAAAACALGTIVASAPASASYAHNTTFAELKARPHTAKPDARLRYGDQASQFVELWLPKGRGPHPVVIMIHGGCWIEKVAGLNLQDFVSEDLRAHGVAVWNVEYRRLGEPGAGYPGTFEDVAKAVDLLGADAAKYHLKLERVVAVGHSAGGHLGLWAAARPKLPKSSPLWRAHPQRIDAVVAIGQLGDLHDDPEVTANACGADTIAKLVGPPTASHPDVYADTSPDLMEPFAARQILMHGSVDDLAPPKAGELYRDSAEKHGGKVEFIVIPNANHFDLITPGTDAWSRIRAVILDQLKSG